MAAMMPIYGAHHELRPVEKCYGQNCVSVGYSIIGDSALTEQYSWIDDIMQSVAHQNGLTFNEDVKKQNTGPLEKFFKNIELNPNTTKYSVVWCTDEWEVNAANISVTLPCKFDDQT